MPPRSTDKGRPNLSATDQADEAQYAAAFRAMHAAAEAVRAAGVTGPDVWALLFGVLQDQQAADLGMGSDGHRDEVTMQRDGLAHVLDTWDVRPMFSTA